MDKTKQAFSEEDILNVFPIVKHIAPKVITVEYVYIINKFFCVFQIVFSFLYPLILSHIRPLPHYRIKKECPR